MTASARHSEIARRYAWHSQRQNAHKAPLTMTTLRTAELERLFRHRFGGLFPETRDGLSALIVMAEHHLQRNDRDTVVKWILARAPWAEDVYAEGIVDRAAAGAQRTTASVLGWRIKLTAEERRRFKIRTIRAVGQTDATMSADRNCANRERKERQRRQAGATPRAMYEATSKAQTKPWEAMGMSRATWYRKGQPKPPDHDVPKMEAVPSSDETGASAIKIEILVAEGPVSGAEDWAPAAPCALARAFREAVPASFSGNFRS